MFPNNYVQSQAVTVLVLVDNEFDGLPIDELVVDLGIAAGGCQLVGVGFAASLTLRCTFATPTTATLDIKVYHPLFIATTLALSSTPVPILPTPTSNCNNQQCDSCSAYNGN